MSEERYQLLTKKTELFPLSEKVNGHRIFMYRDNPEDFGFGGNKVRFFEYLIPEIIREQPDILVTTGSMYSNHIRVTAQVAAKLSIPCKLFLTEETLPSSLTGNVALARSFGAELQCVGQFAVLLKVNEYVKEMEATGKKVFLVPNGGHTPGAIRAYAQVIDEALTKLEMQKIRPKAIYLPCASGTTQAGVLCGAARHKLPPVISFVVANTPERAEKGIRRLIQNASEYLPQGFAVKEIFIQDSGKKDYGHPDEELLDLRTRISTQNGVLLDPTYNVNAFYGMMQELYKTSGTEDVLYINTGGYTGLL